MTASTTTIESGWVGDRDPRDDDVRRANELPQVAWLHEYKTKLLASMGKTGHTPRLRRLPFQQSPRQPDTCTYPLQLLSDIPDLPSSAELEDLRNVFNAIFANQEFLQSYEPPVRGTSLSPHLQLAYATIGAVASAQDDPSSTGHTAASASQLFNAGVRMYGVMTETNNTESRSGVAVLSTTLLATFGVLSVDTADRNWADSILGFTLAMERWQKAADDGHPETRRRRSALTCYVFLVAVLQSLVCDTLPLMSSEELTLMPSTSSGFTEAYSSLSRTIDVNTHQLSDHADALVLLIALLSDRLFVEHSYRSVSQRPVTADMRNGHGANVLAYPAELMPASASRDYLDLEHRTLQSLHRWHDRFASAATKEILALYYYAELRISYTNFGGLLRDCGYQSYQRLVSDEGATHSEVSGQSVRLAWLVLDQVDVRKRRRESLHAIWLPPVLFHSALIIWRSQTQQKTGPCGSLKALGLFAKELDELPWPCCGSMATCLRRLQDPALGDRSS
ncbi:hypothetical protein LTR53_001126 [Teratosphaeriaceae sp. CCFEE 6253]|nr:hypothetical protein LTR53_001126 [Teratosphaeriaceae sp. CCFEE 6253]